MLTRFAPSLAAMAAGTLLTVAQASADVSRAELMVNTCLACHSGNAADSSNATIPDLTVGYPSSVITSQMKAFRDGTRPSTVMGRHASGYSDAEIEAIAEYFDAMNQ